MGSITRRGFLKQAVGGASALAFLPLVAAACGGSSAAGGSGGGSQSKTVRVMINGGTTEDAFKKIVFGPLQQQAGISVQTIPALSAEMLTRVRAEAGHPTVDVVLWDDIVGVQARQAGLVEKIDPAQVPNMKDLKPEATYGDGYGPAITANIQCFAWNTDHYKGPIPKSLKELWDPQYKGDLVVASTDTTSGVLFLLEASLLHGGSYENMDPGFKAMNDIKPNVAKFYHTVAEPTTALENDPVLVVGGSSSAYVLILKKEPIKVAYPDEGAWLFPGTFDIVKGSPAKAASLQLLNAILDPKNQADIAKTLLWEVYNAKAPIDASIQDLLPKKINVWDPAKVAKNREQWVARWKREIGG